MIIKMIINSRKAQWSGALIFNYQDHDNQYSDTADKDDCQNYNQDYNQYNNQ